MVYLKKKHFYYQLDQTSNTTKLVIEQKKKIMSKLKAT